MSELEGNSPDQKLDRAGLLPGMALIALWMLAQCALGFFGVFTGRLPWPALVLCVMFAFAANGLVKRKRWGWALTLAAAFLSMTYAAWMLFHFHQLPMIFMLAVNLVFFLYLVRPEVLARVK